jgi:hypothetical protein
MICVFLQDLSYDLLLSESLASSMGLPYATQILESPNQRCLSSRHRSFLRQLRGPAAYTCAILETGSSILQYKARAARLTSAAIFAC